MSAWAFARHRVWPFLRAVGKRFSDDQGSVLAGYLAYSAMLSLMPFLVFATALAGFLVGPENSDDVLDLMFSTVPEHVALTLEPVVREVIGQRRSDILTLSALGAIWAASNGIEALRVGFDHAYDVGDSRHIALNRAYAILLVLVGIAIFAVLATLIILAPLAFRLVEGLMGIEVSDTAVLARYGAGLGLLWVALWLTHRFLPSRDMRGFRLWPGVLASVVLWGVMASGMSIYLVYAPSYSLTYGTLAGVILTLLFFYLTGAALIMGAQVNAVVNEKRLGAATRGGAKQAEGTQI